MLLFLILFTVFVAIQGGAVPSNFQNGIGKILGGSRVTIDQVPWQVAVEAYGELACGGSIISPNYILTSAKCTYRTDPENIIIRSGSDQLLQGGITTKVLSIEQHPQYSIENYDHDISVIKLVEPLELSAENNQLAIVLSSVVPGTNTTALISGWGQLLEVDLDYSNDLQAVELPILEFEACRYPYWTFGINISNRIICAGAAGKDACWGDLGGALVVDSQQVGITSMALGCGDKMYPRLYTKVTDHKSYIDENSNNEAQWA